MRMCDGFLQNHRATVKGPGASKVLGNKEGRVNEMRVSVWEVSSGVGSRE